MISSGMSQQQELELVEQLAGFAHDPLGFVRWAFPWGEPGELEAFKEPFSWQCAYLEKLGELIKQPRPALLATASGNGVGKSALNGMETWWAFSTFPGTRGIITANTEVQLRTKTWVEMNKWHRLFIARDFFNFTASAIFSADEELAKEWRIDCIPWSAKNPEAFAGLHNLHKRIVVLFDEASSIDDIIWESTEGALTDPDTEIMWSVKGNPTRNSGRFRECFPGGRFAKRWSPRNIDIRTVPNHNKEQVAAWLEDFGEDSDFFRIHATGTFPRHDENSFISYDVALEASRHTLIQEDPSEPLIMGVDVGRFGDDPSVILVRQGSDARSRPTEIIRGMNTVHLADRVASTYNALGASVCFVDEGGVGGGVVDRLQMLGINVIGVQFGAGADSPNPLEPQIKYANKRAEMWGAMRHALRHLCIPFEVRGLTTAVTGQNTWGPVNELSAPLYDYSKQQNEAIVIESKKSMKLRGVPSPNWADALALTYAYPSLSSQLMSAVRRPTQEYDPFAPEKAA